jgi:hypothetical protein
MGAWRGEIAHAGVFEAACVPRHWPGRRFVWAGWPLRCSAGATPLGGLWDCQHSPRTQTSEGPPLATGLWLPLPRLLRFAQCGTCFVLEATSAFLCCFRCELGDIGPEPLNAVFNLAPFFNREASGLGWRSCAFTYFFEAAGGSVGFCRFVFGRRAGPRKKCPISFYLMRSVDIWTLLAHWPSFS